MTGIAGTKEPIGFFCKKSWWVFFVLSILISKAGAQTISLDLDAALERVRDAQLQGLVDSSISMMVLPLDWPRANNLNHDSLVALDQRLWPSATKSSFHWNKTVDRPKWLLTLLPIHFRHQYNQHHNYGWQNGPMVPNKGQQMYISGGLHLAWRKYVSAQIRPEAIWVQNHPFMLPPVRHGGIDNPDRFGTLPFVEAFAGQSFIKAHLGAFSMGVSTENVQWGPARHGSLLLSRNAPGFLHFTVHTNRPVKTPIGKFEGQFIGGRLRYSGFYPYSIDGVPVSETEPSSLGSKEHSKLSAISLNYQPKWVPGLFLGGGLGIQTINASGLRGLTAALIPGSERENNANIVAQNGLLSLHVRYLLPAVQAELYGELGRDDWWYDLQDLATDPFHTTVFLLGMNKLRTLGKNDHYLRFGFEFTKLMGPMTQLSRGPGNSFYTHSNGIGWTHRGQILGVGLPPGSIRHTLGAQWHKGLHLIGLQLERIEYAQDLYYFRMPFLYNPNIGNPLAMDYTKRFIDLLAKLKVQIGRKNLVIGTEAMLVRTLNFQWIYEHLAAPDPFRYPGHNFWSLNMHSYLYYRF